MAEQVVASKQQVPIPTLTDSVVVRWLIGLCLVLYGLNLIFTVQVTSANGTSKAIGLLSYYGNFNVPQGINDYELWRLFTYQFLHGNLLHLGMNMMALYVFGPLIEKWWGPRRFLAFYLLCGACGAWLMAVFAFNPTIINGQNAWLVGASGSIFGVLVASAMLYPKDEVKLIIPPMWVTIRNLAIVFILLSIGSMFVGFNAGGNAAHLGGAIFGYLLVKRPWSLDLFDKNAPALEPPGKSGAEDDPPAA
ncbi:MAG: rhomboid family intramembrane serine protease, partial [Planctomycetota bacterium]